MTTKDTIENSMLPISLISGAGLFGLALYNRLTIVIERLRRFDRELLQEYDRQEHNEIPRQHRIVLYQKQIKSLNRAAMAIKFSILCILASSITTLVSSLVISIENSSYTYEISNVFHIISLCFLIISLLFAGMEMSFATVHVIQEEKTIMKEISQINLNLGLNP
jgi:Protein of unknown function (DUF2721)